MTFRKDINGLRAIAVIAVVLFHFRITGFTGGFSGVDIFFVISGYLMTGIIFSKLAKSQFSLVDFYLHRARRIIPALAVLCLALVIFGFLQFLTHEYRETMRNIKSAIQFTSNIAFNDDFGYFDSPSLENWLLHTWSLSVEWQFYLIYPLFIVLLRKFISLKLTKLILVVAAISSLALSIFYTPIDPSSAFYLLPTRMWEMLAGGIVFLFPISFKSIQKYIAQYLGLALILISVLLFNEQVLWPGYLATIPVLGTMLIIWANQANLITDNIISQWLGKISYSVYLWHWPIVVLLFTAGLLDNMLYIIAGIVASLILGSLSYFFIEKRMKLKYSRVIEVLRYLLIIGLVTGIAASMASIVKNHPKVRTGPLFSDKVADIILISDARNPYDKCLQQHNLTTFPECKIGEGKPNIIVFGDSHANVTFSALLKANDKGASILWAYMGCPILDNVNFSISRRDGCKKLIKEKMALLATDYPDVPVLMINRLFNTLGNEAVNPIIYFDKPVSKPDDRLRQQFRESYLRTICTISKNRQVYIMKPIPEPFFNVPKKLIRELLFSLPLTSRGESLDGHYKVNHFILGIMEEAQQRCGAILLDPVPYLCPEGKCIYVEDSKPLYFDDNHLSEYGNKRLVPLFKQLINELP